MAEKKRKSPKKGGGSHGNELSTETSDSQQAPLNIQSIASQMATNPQVMAAVQKQLDSMVGKSSGYIESLPESIQKRIKALKNNQVDIMKAEVEFNLEVCRLQRTFVDKFTELYSKRSTIVTGEYEPTEEECVWSRDDDDEEEKELDVIKEEGQGGDKEEDKAKNGTDKEGSTTEGETSKSVKEKGEDIKGIPGFWLTAMRNVQLLEGLIKDWDEPILEKLTDIRLVYPDENGLNFQLEFIFEENDYFSDKVIVKKYISKCEIDEEDPFTFEGPELIATVGAKINWKKDKNVTVKTVRKTQKNKSKGQTRTVTKTVDQDSFFHFFDSLPELKEEEEEEDSDLQEKRSLDFARGEFLRDNFIPKAVLYFTGDVVDIESEEEYLDEDEEYEEDEDPDYEPQQGQAPAECKQQ